MLGTGGTFSVELAPNAGATPAGIAYTVVYQLNDATVKTETWSVGTSSPETIAQVRTFIGTSTAAGQLATQQYVNAALANVVHISGSETITGAKQFAVGCPARGAFGERQGAPDHQSPWRLQFRRQFGNGVRPDPQMAKELDQPKLRMGMGGLRFIA